MTDPALSLGAALVAFGPTLSLFTFVVYQKSQLVIVVTSAAFYFLLAALCASVVWRVLDVIGLGGPLAALVPGVFFQFIFRCGFVRLYHKVESVIQASMDKSDHDNVNSTNAAAGGGAPTAALGSTASINGSRGANLDANVNNLSEWQDAAKLRLALNDASCGVAAGVGFGGFHAVLLYGTLLASEMQNVGVLYQDSCPAVPSLMVSALYAFCFAVLDMFWMLFTFFGMRRRLMFHRGESLADPYYSGPTRPGHYLHHRSNTYAVGGWLGNSRTGGNLALLLCLLTHMLAAVFTTTDYFSFGCVVSLPCLGGLVLVVAYLFWAGCGRIYMPPSQQLPAEPPLTSDHSTIDPYNDDDVPAGGNRGDDDGSRTSATRQHLD